MEVKANSSAGTEEMLMGHADVCVLRLLEALLQSLPHLLLQVYAVFSEPASLIPGESLGYAWIFPAGTVMPSSVQCISMACSALVGLELYICSLGSSQNVLSY